MTEPFQNAELAVVGAALLHRTQAPLLVAELTPEHFGDPLLAQVWTVIANLLDDGVPPDPGLVASKLPHKDLLGRLMEATWAAPSDALPHARQVKDDAAVRAVLSIAQQLAGVPRPSREDAQAAVERMTHAVMRGSHVEGLSMTAAVDGALERSLLVQSGKLPKGIETGITDLDDVLGGLFPGDLFAIGARPGVGKTALVRNVLHGVADRSLGEQDRIILVSLEMDEIQMGGRQASANAYGLDRHLAPPYRDLRRGRISPEQAALIRRANDLPAGYRVLFRPGCSIGDVMSLAYHEHAAALLAGGRLALLGVDYLQLMAKPEAARADLAYAVITGALKRLAQDLGCTVVLAAQLNRGSEKQERRPRMSDFRECGSLEQDADQIILLHDEQEAADTAYQDGRDSRRQLTGIVDKNRHGRKGDVALFADLAFDIIASAAGD